MRRKTLRTGVWRVKQRPWCQSTGGMLLKLSWRWVIDGQGMGPLASPTLPPLCSFLLQPLIFCLAHRLTPHYIYPPAIVQPSVVIPATPVPSLSSPYLEYTPSSPAYAQYPPAAYDQYPYAASPATATSFVGYGYPAAMPPALSAAAPAGTTFLQYQAPQLQPDRMQ